MDIIDDVEKIDGNLMISYLSHNGKMIRDHSLNDHNR